MKETLIFVYGTLKRSQPNYKYLVDTNTGDAKFICDAKTIDKWPLVIGSKFNIPYLLNEKGIGNRIVGEVYAVNESKLAFLDDFEGYPSYYTREQIPVEVISNGVSISNINVEDGVIKPWIYLLTDYYPNMLQQTMYECYDSYGDHGLKYVERFERINFGDYDPLNDVKFNYLRQ